MSNDIDQKKIWVIALIYGWLLSGLGLVLIGKLQIGFMFSLIIFIVVTLGVACLGYYIEICQNNRDAARERKAEYEKTICTCGHTVDEHDYDGGECEVASCMCSKFDNDLIDDD